MYSSYRIPLFNLFLHIHYKPNFRECKLFF